MKRDSITPLLLTYNEAPNIGRSLSTLRWATRIIVVDSGSDDGTLEMIRQVPQAEIFHRKFDTHARQWNFGIEQVTSPFVLTLDADYMLSPEFVTELERLNESDAEGWFASFRYCIQGRMLRSTLYPPRLVLFRTQGARYFDDGHTQRIRAPATTGTLGEPIRHDDRKDLTRWLNAQRAYSVLEAERLLARQSKQLTWRDRLRLIYLGPILTLIYCLFVKRLILDGADGWFYSGQRVYAEMLLVLRILDARTKL